MKKILFPTDFSAASESAFIYALGFAQAMKAEIVTLGAYKVNRHVYNEDPGYPEMNELGEFENFRDELPNLHDTVHKYGAESIKITHRLESGPVVESILKAAEAEKPDCIIMGTGGVEDFYETVTGTTTQNVMAGARVPVLAIPEKCKYKTIKRMLFLTRFEKKHVGSLKRLQQFANLSSARIDAVELIAENNINIPLLLDPWRREFAGFDIHFHVLQGIVSRGSLQMILEHTRPDLLAFEQRPDKPFKGLFYKSVSQELTSNFTMPILTLPVE